MPEKVLFEQERTQSRPEVAAYLRDVADKLDDDGSITFTAGDQSVTVEVPTSPTFEVKVEREGPRDGPGAELSVEFELEWPEHGGESGQQGDLSIE